VEEVEPLHLPRTRSAAFLADGWSKFVIDNCSMAASNWLIVTCRVTPP
jgi:hypothetical protein